MIKFTRAVACAAFCALAAAQSPKIVTEDGDLILQGAHVKMRFNGDQETTVADLSSSITSVAQEHSNLVDNVDILASTVSASISSSAVAAESYTDISVSLVNATLTNEINTVRRQVDGMDILTPSQFITRYDDGQAATIQALTCAMRLVGGVVDASGSCVCPNSTVQSNNECISLTGLGRSSNMPGADCATILGKWPEAPDGTYWIRPASTTFQAYCDMTTDGGGWTLIESYDISQRSVYRQASFHQSKNMPRGSVPTSQSGGQWDNYRLSAAHMMPLIARSTEFHQRCDRNFSLTLNDYVIGDISAFRVLDQNGVNTRPKVGYNVYSMRGAIRGLPISNYNLRYFHHSTSNSRWHAGFDVAGQLPGAGSSEDIFTWHDGALNSNHRCHTTAGDITAWVRGPLNLGSKENPAMSCLQILKTEPHTAKRDGPYFLQLPKNGLTNVYCDMTSHDGGWTQWLSANQGVQVFSWPSANFVSSNGIPGFSKVRPTFGSTPSWKFGQVDINFIRTSWKIWGSKISPPVVIADDDASYWRTTPQSGVGLWGAESFHRQDCEYQANRRSGQIKSSTCQLNRWWYKTGKNTLGSSHWTGTVLGPTSGDWLSGGHWWDNSAGYAETFGYHNEGHHGTGSQCFGYGRGLGYHSGSLAPFHRGWCGTAAWGMEFVRG